MPNHVINEVVLHGVSLESAASQTLGVDGKIDFSILLPLPLHFWPGSVGIHHQRAFPGTHLDAARKIWGTKWNAYGQDDEEYVPVIEDDGSVVFTFQTAWGPPRSWVVALFSTFKCDITHSWLSEGGIAAHVETYCFAGLEDLSRQAWQDVELEDGCAEHRRLHKLLWGVEEFTDDDD